MEKIFCKKFSPFKKRKSLFKLRGVGSPGKRRIFTMLHKGKLLAALHAKRGQFSAYDGSFGDQLDAYRRVLEKLYLGYPSGEQLAFLLTPDRKGLPPARARTSVEVDRWLGYAPHEQYQRPLFSLRQEIHHHHRA